MTEMGVSRIRNKNAVRDGVASGGGSTAQDPMLLRSTLAGYKRAAAQATAEQQKAHEELHKEKRLRMDDEEQLEKQTALLDVISHPFLLITCYRLPGVCCFRVS